MRRWSQAKKSTISGVEAKHSWGLSKAKEVRAQPQRLQGFLVQPRGSHKALQGFIQEVCMVSHRGTEEDSEAWTRVAL